jgi:hypothetical protein
MTRKKLQNEDISEILVADTNLESGAEASDVEHDFEEVEGGSGGSDDDDNNNHNNNNKPQQKSKHKLQQVMDYQPGDCLKEGTQIFILMLVQQEVCKKV